MYPLSSDSSHTIKPPRAVLKTVFAFSPNRNTLGGTAYLIVGNEGNMLVDCPILDNLNLDFLTSSGGVRQLFITHRGAINDTANIQQIFGCEVFIQEQEAYLLPKVRKTTFSHEISLSSKLLGIWTPGHSPGSSCLYYSEYGGVLFSGRHLLPNPQGELEPLKAAKTFHWQRQLESFESLKQRFKIQPLQYICPGANTGFLRGKGVGQWGRV